MSAQTYELEICLPRAAAEALCAALEELTPAAGLLDEGGHWKVQAWFETPPDEERLKQLIHDLGGTAATGYALNTLQQEDWVAKSLEGLKPVRMGPYVVHGSHEEAAFAPNLHRIRIDAGLAFGTGHHGTTRPCLLALYRHLKRARPENVLDLGTGSGVLAIAAAKTLRQDIMASDIDPEATRVASANAALNEVGALVKPVTASGFHHPAFRDNGPFDLILANILARPLTRLAPDMRRHLAPGGTLILSGLLACQAPSVRAAYRIQGIVPEQTVLMDGWATLTMRG